MKCSNRSLIIKENSSLIFSELSKGGNTDFCFLSYILSLVLLREIYREKFMKYDKRKSFGVHINFKSFVDLKVISR